MPDHGCSKYKVLLTYLRRDKVGVDDRGQDIVGFTPVFTFRAEVLSSTGSEERPGRKLVNMSRYQFRTRYRDNVRTTGRLRYGQRIFEISNVADPDLCRNHITIDAMEMR